MPESDLTRRNWLAIASATAGVLASGPSICSASTLADEPFLLGLNTSTIRGQNLPITQEAELAAQAGFRGIEPWIGELDAHVKAGGSLDQLARQFRDLKLSVESAIGFFEWAVDDEARRRKGLDEAKRNLEMVRAIGGKRLAAPPVGLTDRSDVDCKRLAERYRTLLELGDTVGVVPQVEVWGFSKTLGRLGEAAHVAIGADHPRACILADVYHLYKGGSGFHGIKLLGKDAIHVFHVNDYPEKPPRESITDADRVYPGDGVAPLKTLFQDLRAIGFQGMLSIELFNRAYWKQDAATVLKTAIEKLRTVLRASLDGTPGN
jgi:2-keto-myo-inositol isomerase